MPKKTCEHCGKIFNNWNKRFCSYTCYLAWVDNHRLTKHPNWGQRQLTCNFCGKKFFVQKYRIDVAQYCSRECANKAQRLTTGENHPLWGGRDSRMCPKCKKVFTIYPNSPQHFCSQECAGIARNRVTISCAHCEKEFTTTPTLLKRGRRFCSRHCMFAYKGQSSIEKLLAKELRQRGIDFEHQYHIENGNPKGWWIDFAFPDHKLAIEADGNYWHSIPEIIEKDARKDANLQSQGWTILRFTGDEIRESPAACVDEIVKVLKTKTALLTVF